MELRKANKLRSNVRLILIQRLKVSNGLSTIALTASTFHKYELLSLYINLCKQLLIKKQSTYIKIVKISAI